MKMRTVVSNCFLDDNQVPKSELPKRLESVKTYLVLSAMERCKRLAKSMDQWRFDGLFENFSSSWAEFTKTHLNASPEWIFTMQCAATVLELGTEVPPDVTDAVNALRHALLRYSDPETWETIQLIESGEIDSSQGIPDIVIPEDGQGEGQE